MAEPFGSSAELGALELGAAQLGSIESAAEITPSTGALTLTGQAVSTYHITPNTGALNLTGQQATVDRTNDVTPASVALTLAGQLATVATKSQIISAEYVGDGASTRSFASSGFAPLFVIVVGKDGSGNVVGALKSHTMPSGKSQPFDDNQALAATTRDDRILSLDTNGFTVGSNLNVTGRNYAYIMFPAGRYGSVTSGSYIGAAETSVGHATISITGSTVTGIGPGSTPFVRPTDCEARWYRPVDDTMYTPGASLILGGRRIIRDSDGAVLAEATEFINSSQCTAIVYISGTPAAWHWEEQYIELNTLVPDMLLLMADGAAVFHPATICPPPNVMTTNRSWEGNGGGAYFCFFASNTESALHIFDEPGGIAYNTKDVQYHWLALKGDEAGSGGVLIKTFQYTGTGDGPYPIDLVGCGFDPEWAYIQGGNDQFHWSKRSGSGIIGSNTSRRWVDGTGDHILVNPTYTITFVTDGVQIPATNTAYNQLGVEYTVLLIGVSDPLIETTTITPNTAELHLTGQQTTATPNVTAITPQTGSLILTPRNPLAAQSRLITPNRGTLTLAGKAAKTKETHTPGPPPKTRNETPDTADGADGLQITGRQPVLNTSIIPAAGALTVAGQQGYVQPPDFLEYVQSGELSFVGQSPQQIVTITPTSGSLVIDGKAVLPHLSVPSRITLDTGILGLSGQQAILDIALIPVTGELQLQTFNTEPIVETDVTKITPLVGNLSISGIQPPDPGALSFSLTPNAGALILTGQPVILAAPGDVDITPNTGSLILTGRPAIVLAPGPVPPIPPTPPGVPAGGPALPTPRKLPFWPTPIITARGRIVEPAATLRGTARVEEDELSIFLD